MALEYFYFKTRIYFFFQRSLNKTSYCCIELSLLSAIQGYQVCFVARLLIVILFHWAGQYMV